MRRTFACGQSLPARNRAFQCVCVKWHEPALSLDDAKANCQIIVAALQSAAQGRVVKLAE